MVKYTIANERSLVFVHQNGGDDVACKPPIKDVIYLFFNVEILVFKLGYTLSPRPGAL